MKASFRSRCCMVEMSLSFTSMKLTSGHRELTIIFIIRRIVLFLSIGRRPTTWPVNNCLQIMACSCVAPLFKRVLLQIIFCSGMRNWNHALERKMADRFPELAGIEVIKRWKQTWRSNDKTIIELGHRKISRFVSTSQINYYGLSLRLRQMIDLLASDKSRYFAQPRPIIVNLQHFDNNTAVCSSCVVRVNCETILGVLLGMINP